MTSTASYSERISFLRHAVQEADHIIIGAGSGLTTAAGIDYAGDDFRREFAPWIERYGFTDLYTSSFHPFETPEEYWAYWAKHIWFSRYRTGATELYKTLLHRFPEAFIVTTNVDAQFELAGFPTERIFATQGDYRWFQPASGSPKTLVDNREWVFRVLPLIHDCRIPTEMIPTMSDGSPACVLTTPLSKISIGANRHTATPTTCSGPHRTTCCCWSLALATTPLALSVSLSSRWRSGFPIPPSSDSTATTPNPTSKICLVLPPLPKTSPLSSTRCRQTDIFFTLVLHGEKPQPKALYTQIVRLI